MTMPTACLRQTATVFALALLCSTYAAAQDYEPGYDSTGDYDHYEAPATSPLMKELEARMAWTALDYWTTQLNVYKSRIDRTVAPCDLAELNRLRVYWSIFLDEKKWQGLIEGVDDIFGAGTHIYGDQKVSVDTAVYAPDYADGYDEDAATDSYMTLDTAIVAVPAEAEPEYAIVAEAVPYDDAEYAEADTVAIATVEPAIGYDEEGEHQEEMMAPEWNGGSEYEVSEEERQESLRATLAYVDKISEMAETFFVAKWIARRYRPEFDKIREQMEADADGFIDSIMAVKERFEREHAAEIAADPEVSRLLAEFRRDQADEILAKFGTDKSAVMIYNVVIEPLLLLYNGQDLRKLLKEVEALPEEISTLPLPEMSALRQNVPNPAATATTITYVLDEPSSSTVFRIYDSRGELMAVEDEGSQPAGEHQVEIDISKFPSGSYLYHLTLQGARGERVYSKTMQVMR